jgi:hypothetical protein
LNLADEVAVFVFSNVSATDDLVVFGGDFDFIGVTFEGLPFICAVTSSSNISSIIGTYSFSSITGSKNTAENRRCVSLYETDCSDTRASLARHSPRKASASLLVKVASLLIGSAIVKRKPMQSSDTVIFIGHTFNRRNLIPLCRPPPNRSCCRDRICNYSSKRKRDGLPLLRCETVGIVPLRSYRGCRTHYDGRFH